MAISRKKIVTDENGRKIVELNPHFFCGNKNQHIGINMPVYKSSTDRWHRHNNFYEINICCGGSARNEYDSESSVIHSGNIQFFPPGSCHRYTAINNFRHYNVLFMPDVLDAFPDSFVNLKNYKTIFKTDNPPLLQLKEKDFPQFVAVLENMMSEYFTRSEGWYTAILADFMKTLLTIMRKSIPAGQKSNDAAYQISCAARKMEEHPEKSASIAKLAAEANMSESSFRHHFREITGISPIKYIILLRLRRAVLLLHSQHSVTDTAFMSGFTDINYFCRQFRKYLKHSPRELREKLKSGEISVAQPLDRLIPQKE